MKKILMAMTFSAAAVFAEPEILDSYPDGALCTESTIGTIYGYKYYSEAPEVAGYMICVHHIYDGGSERFAFESCTSATECPASEDDQRHETGSSSSTTTSETSAASAECQWYPSNVTCDEGSSGTTVQCSGNPGDPLMTFKCNGNSWENITGSVSSSSAAEATSSEASPAGSSTSESPTSSAEAPASSASGTPESSATTAIENVAIPANFQVVVHGAILSISIASGSKVQVQVFDIMGHVVNTDVKSLSAGTHSVSLQSLAQGSYMVRVNSGSSTQTVRMNVR